MPSKYHGNNEVCPHCGIKYKHFRVNLTFAEAVSRLTSHDPDTKTWRYKRRNTVLGVMFAEKQHWWKHHKSQGCPLIFQPGDEHVGEIRDEAVEGVPF